MSSPPVLPEGGIAELKSLIKNAFPPDKVPPRPPQPPQVEPSPAIYQPKLSIMNALTLGGQSAIFGAFIAGIRNALSGRNLGFFKPIGLFASVGATFALTESVVANQRQTNDALNGASAACAAGFLLGLRTKSFPVAVGTCAVMGGMMGMYDYAGGLGGDSVGKQRFFKPTAIVEAPKS
ncbi:hypothetical protein C8J57DRAFT_29130 [Mycena rebaudengoi]|nr:hypothetical protein C8J57DRAFT_29130 [Mycena rebaudengoi]